MYVCKENLVHTVDFWNLDVQNPEMSEIQTDTQKPDASLDHFYDKQLFCML